MESAHAAAAEQVGGMQGDLEKSRRLVDALLAERKKWGEVAASLRRQLQLETARSQLQVQQAEGEVRKAAAEEQQQLLV